MRAFVSRDSVCAADDLNFPNSRVFDIPDDWTWEVLIDNAWRKSDLPQNIIGGRATWALSSRIPLAVAAQQWNRPKVLYLLDSERGVLDTSDNEIRLHWSYFGQTEPQVVLDVLRQLRLRASL